MEKRVDDRREKEESVYQKRQLNDLAQEEAKERIIEKVIQSDEKVSNLKNRKMQMMQSKFELEKMKEQKRNN